ncbi:hypothetical protein K1719_014254 [Acacia pycnantha]|nr:hypothetical protein K1719_014254 [Acacia pycnantha]
MAVESMGLIMKSPTRPQETSHPSSDKDEKEATRKEEFIREQDHQNHKRSNNNGSSSSSSDESLSVPFDVSSSCSESIRLKKGMRGTKTIGEAEAAHIVAQTLMDMHLYGHSQFRVGLPPHEPTPEATQLPVKERMNNVMNNNVGGSSSPAVIDLIKEKKKLNKKKRKLGTEMIKSEGEPQMIRTVKQEDVRPS